MHPREDGIFPVLLLEGLEIITGPVLHVLPILLSDTFHYPEG
jgi:hypothetical protein